MINVVHYAGGIALGITLLLNAGQLQAAELSDRRGEGYGAQGPALAVGEEVKAYKMDFDYGCQAGSNHSCLKSSTTPCRRAGCCYSACPTVCCCMPCGIVAAATGSLDYKRAEKTVEIMMTKGAGNDLLCCWGAAACASCCCCCLPLTVAATPQVCCKVPGYCGSRSIADNICGLCRTVLASCLEGTGGRLSS